MKDTGFTSLLPVLARRPGTGQGCVGEQLEVRVLASKGPRVRLQPSRGVPWNNFILCSRSF